MDLANSLAHLRTGDHTAALVHLLSAWRTYRDPRLAGAIEMVSIRLPGTRPSGRSIEVKQTAWLAMANNSAPSAIGPLMATLDDTGKANHLRDRISAIAERDPDPRIAARLVALIERPPYWDESGVMVIKAALQVIVANYDPRQLVALDRIIAHGVGAGTSVTRFIAAHLPKYRSALAKKCEGFPIVADPSVLTEIEGFIVVPQQEATLITAVYANPEDDEPRSVLADVLQRRGDPRGEFIALQLARARGGPRTKRERTLLAANRERDWIGPIEPLILKKSAAFERGFLSRCALHSQEQSLFETMVDHPAWRTLTELNVARTTFETSSLVAKMPALRVLRGASVSEVPDKHPRLERLECRALNRGNVRSLITKALPALRHLAFNSSFMVEPEELAPLWSSSLGRQLESFSVVISPMSPLEGWMRMVSDVRIPSITLMREYFPWAVRLEGNTARLMFVGSTSGARAFVAGRRSATQDADTYSYLLPILSAIPSTRRVVLETVGVEPPADVMTALEAFAEHQLV